jgi:hypothetical protein
MARENTHPLERFWPFIANGEVGEAARLVERDGTWDDPLFDAASGEVVQSTAIPRLAVWYQGRCSGRASVQHLRTTADEKRVVVENVLSLKDGVIWNQAKQRSEKADRFELATAIVGDRASKSAESYRSLRRCLTAPRRADLSGRAGRDKKSDGRAPDRA